MLAKNTRQMTLAGAMILAMMASYAGGAMAQNSPEAKPEAKEESAIMKKAENATAPANGKKQPIFLERPSVKSQTMPRRTRDWERSWLAWLRTITQKILTTRLSSSASKPSSLILLTFCPR